MAKIYEYNGLKFSIERRDKFSVTVGHSLLPSNVSVLIEAREEGYAYAESNSMIGFLKQTPEEALSSACEILHRKLQQNEAAKRAETASVQRRIQRSDDLFDRLGKLPDAGG